jgi:uncharacterized membrane protein
MKLLKHEWIYIISLFIYFCWCVATIFLLNDSRMWMIYVAVYMCIFCVILRFFGIFHWDRQQYHTWIGILHSIGLTNLTDEQIRQYEDKFKNEN